MSTKPVNQTFQIVDAKGANLDKIDAYGLKSHRAALLRNLASVTTEEYHRFADNFGFPLPYGDTIEKAFTGEASKEDDLHYDGISSTDTWKIPNYLIFYVEKGLEPGVGGDFRIIDCVRAIELMPPELLSFLRRHKLQFFGYQLYQQPPIGPTELSFEIDCITVLHGVERLRIHLPFDTESQELTEGGRLVYSKPHDFSLCFAGCDGKETMRVFDDVREVLRAADVMWNISFQDNDLLVVDNEFAFHGRDRLSRPSSRIMRRIQLLSSPYRPSLGA